MTASQRLNKKKYIVLTAITLILFLSILMILLQCVNAASTPVVPVNQSGIPSQFFALFAGEELKSLLGLSGPMMPIIKDWTSNAGSALSGLAIIWVTALTIYAIIKEVAHGDASINMWVKITVKFVLFLFVITTTNAVLDGIEVVGRGIIDLVATSQYDQTLAGLSSSDVLSLMSQEWIAFALIEFLLIYIKFVSYGLLIEIGLRRIFAPLATASLVVEGFRGAGLNFYKKYLIVYIKMGIMAATMILGGLMCASMQHTALDIFPMLAVLCACTTFIGKGDRIAKDIVNAVLPGDNAQ